MEIKINCTEYDTIRYHGKRLKELGYTKIGDCHFSQIWVKDDTIIILNRE